MTKNVYRKARRIYTKHNPYFLQSCYWCDKPIFNLAVLNFETREKVKNLFSWDKLLTVDHDRRLKDGGSNKIKNLLPSCKPCNSGRETKLKQLLMHLIIKYRKTPLGIEVAEDLQLVIKNNKTWKI